jgi:nucleoside 2-deoxyribosyltransferase
MNSIYTASKPRHAPRWRMLRNLGFNVIATWIDLCDNNDDPIDDWVKLWLDCVREASAADITLVYIEPGDELRGSYIEMGVALASGKRVFLVNPGKVTVTDAVHHPLVTEFSNLGDALVAAAPELQSVAA